MIDMLYRGDGKDAANCLDGAKVGVSVAVTVDARVRVRV
jgi:hypothetical protein